MSRVRVKARRSRSRKKPDKAVVILISLAFFMSLALLYWNHFTPAWATETETVKVIDIDSLHTSLVEQTTPTAATSTPEAMSIKPPEIDKSSTARMIAAGDYILVEKSKHLLHHYRDGNPLASYHVALGKNPADKIKVGDNTTPEGHFTIGFINASHDWTHDFGDGKGEIKGAYGPFFIGIKTDAKGTFSGKTWTGIGIHGTHNPASIGTNASEGCIRLHNNELLKLKAAIEGKTSIPIDIIK